MVPELRQDLSFFFIFLVGRKVCFILDVGNQRGWSGLLPKTTPSVTVTISGQELLKAEGGGYRQKQCGQL